MAFRSSSQLSANSSTACCSNLAGCPACWLHADRSQLWHYMPAVTSPYAGAAAAQCLTKAAAPEVLF